MTVEILREKILSKEGEGNRKRVIENEITFMIPLLGMLSYTGEISPPYPTPAVHPPTKLVTQPHGPNPSLEVRLSQIVELTGSRNWLYISSS